MMLFAKNVKITVVFAKTILHAILASLTTIIILLVKNVWLVIH